MKADIFPRTARGKIIAVTALMLMLSAVAFTYNFFAGQSWTDPHEHPRMPWEMSLGVHVSVVGASAALFAPLLLASFLRPKNPFARSALILCMLPGAGFAFLLMTPASWISLEWLEMLYVHALVSLWGLGVHGIAAWDVATGSNRSDKDHKTKA